MKKKVVVIGAGPAGMMTAGKASNRGLDVTLFEKNDRIGKKILISGKGRCNITNDTDIEGLIENTPGNGNFLYSAFYTFSNRDLIEFFEKLGLKTKVERGGRVFPVSDNSKDVNNALLKFLKKYNVDLKLNSPVKEIKTKNNTVEAVVLKDGTTVYCDSVVLTTGGASYPGTGSTGDGYAMAKALGHTIVDLRPSLVPLITEETWVKDLQGLSLKNVSIQIINNKGRKIYSDFGEMLFTHFGVSGPVILSASRHILDYGYKDVKLVIDLKPALSEEKLDERIIRDFEKYSRKQFKNSLDELLPKKMISVIIGLSDIEPDKFVNQIKKKKEGTENPQKSYIENYRLKTYSGGHCDSGRVSTDEINPSTMESKIIKGLYFAGEVIDVDAYTGALT